MFTSIIIVNYNSLFHLDLCLKSMLIRSKFPFEVLIVDNHSTNDSSFAYLQKLTDPRIRVIYNQTNLGFPKSCNLGLEKAQGDLLVTMNPDVLVPPNWLNRLHWHLTNNENTLIVGPKSMGIGGWQWAGPITFPSDLTAANRKFAYNYHHQSQRTKYLIGCLLCFDRRLLAKIGFFDENMALGADDFDLSLRVRQAGYELRVTNDLLIHHFIHASFKNSNPSESKRLNSASWRYFERKWQPELNCYGWQRLFEDKNPVFPNEKPF